VLGECHCTVNPNPTALSGDRHAVRLHLQVYHSPTLRMLRYINATIYICIAFIELPPWAGESASYPIFAPLSPIDGIPYPTWNLWVLPPSITMSIDMFCIFGFGVEMLFKRRSILTPF